jgi:hypothetical protein
MEERPGLRPRTSHHEEWLPPRAQFGSRVRGGHTTGKYFYFNGVEVTGPGTTLLNAAVLYKEISMYHSASHFLIVPYNAAKHQVGNGLQVDEEEDLDEDLDSSTNADFNTTTVDWSLLSFHWRGEGKFYRLSLALLLNLASSASLSNSPV